MTRHFSAFALLSLCACPVVPVEPVPGPVVHHPETQKGGRYIDPKYTGPDFVNGQLPISAVKAFECDQENVGAGAVVAPTEGATGEGVVIHPAGAGPCTFGLFYRIGAEESPLSTAPGGWILAVARRFPDGRRVVCASSVNHHARATGPIHDIDGVTIRCWASESTIFTATTLAVAPDGDWAAWPRELRAHPTRPNAYLFAWARDFSFQFLNMSDQGRPAADGIYETVLAFDGSALAAEAPVKVSARTNPFKAVERWVPTPEEMAELGDVLDFQLDGGQ